MPLCVASPRLGIAPKMGFWTIYVKTRNHPKATPGDCGLEDAENSALGRGRGPSEGKRK